MIYIYGLHCPIDGSIRYIGKSINPEKRLIAHVAGATGFSYDHHAARWIRKLLAQNMRPSAKLRRGLTQKRAHA